MNGKFLIKAGSILSLADARYFSSRLVDLIGFCFDQNSANCINPVQVQEIIKWIEGPKIAGEFTNQSIDEILNIASVLQLDYLQWTGKLPDKKFLEIDLPKIISLGFEKEIGKEDINDLISRLDIERDFLMVNEEHIPNDSDSLKEVAVKIPVILNLTSNLSAIQKIQQQIPFAGINFELGNTINPEIKSYSDFDALFELAQ